MTQALALASPSLPACRPPRPSRGAGRCRAPFRRDQSATPHPTVGLLSIYSRRDGIVDWRACREADGRHAEVTASHYEMPEHGPTTGAIVSALTGFDVQRR